MSATQPQTFPAAGSYQVDPSATRISLRARHMFGLGGVRASFRPRSGRIELASNGSCEVEATVDAASFSSDNERRDTHVCSADLLDVANHPVILCAAVCQDIRAATTQGLDGTITVRGKAAPVHVEVGQIHRNRDAVLVSARCRVDRYAHGITKVKGLAGRWMTLEIEARAVPASNG